MKNNTSDTTKGTTTIASKRRSHRLGSGAVGGDSRYAGGYRSRGRVASTKRQVFHPPTRNVRMANDPTVQASHRCGTINATPPSTTIAYQYRLRSQGLKGLMESCMSATSH